jgi:hypothetical protein
MKLDATERARQAVLAEDGGRWERWTIDEIFDGHIRLLICRATAAGAPEVVRALAALPLLEDRRGTPGKSFVRDTAMAYEMASVDATWSDETAAFVATPALAAFLGRRTDKPGLPQNRELREGDVFWVFVAFDAPQPGRSRDRWLAAYVDAGAQVWDVTAAARQAVKRLYHRAQRTRATIPPAPPSAPRSQA